MPSHKTYEEIVVGILNKRKPVYAHQDNDLNDGIALAAALMLVLDSIKRDCLRGADKMGMSAAGIQDIIKRIDRAINE